MSTNRGNALVYNKLGNRHEFGYLTTVLPFDVVRAWSRSTEISVSVSILNNDTGSFSSLHCLQSPPPYLVIFLQIHLQLSFQLRFFLPCPSRIFLVFFIVFIFRILLFFTFRIYVFLSWLRLFFSVSILRLLLFFTFLAFVLVQVFVSFFRSDDWLILNSWR